MLKTLIGLCVPGYYFVRRLQCRAQLLNLDKCKNALEMYVECVFLSHFYITIKS